jgi:protein-tyrosine phosphatase
VIDLHCHILPGLDDGAASTEESIAMAEVAHARGIRTAVGTPHVREDYPFDPREIGRRAEQLSRALAEAGIDFRLIAGAEVALSKLPDLDEETLRTLCLGSGHYLLIESPYFHVSDLLENALFDLQIRGFLPVLAHPERCPSFISDIGRLRVLVERGVVCSITAASMMGQFGNAVRRFTVELFRAGLVHDVASDAHDHVNRPMDLRAGFEALAHEVPGALEQAPWFTQAVPAAIIAGEELPRQPDRPAPKDRRWRRLLRG